MSDALPEYAVKTPRAARYNSRMGEKPRRWLTLLLSLIAAAILAVFAVQFVRAAREAGDQDRLRAEVRAGRVDPKVAKDILSQQEFERLDQEWSKEQSQ